MTEYDRPEPELHSRFTIVPGPGMSFEIIETDGEARESVIRVIKGVDVDIEKKPFDILQDVIALIDEAIQEGEIPPEAKKGLIEGARRDYARVFVQ